MFWLKPLVALNSNKMWGGYVLFDAAGLVSSV
jgi:hypothetical protein